MEPIVNYLEDAEKKLTKEMAELFSKMREQREIISLKGIEDMYDIKPLEGVLYEPCVKIPSASMPGRYNYAHIKLPKDEFIIYVGTSHKQTQHNAPPYIDEYSCVATTNYGRVINTIPIISTRDHYNTIIGDGSPTSLTKIEILEPLPYKLPKWFYNAIRNFSNIQELNKEFYLFAGKWQPHMTEHATLDIDTMRQTIIENRDHIQDLMGKNKTLEDENAKLQAELKQLKEQKAVLEKDKAKLLPLEKYKQALMEFMDDHYNGDEPYDHKNTLDIDIIKYFSNWHFGKVFMNEWEYDDVMESKEELNEYRIYKKVKGEMVSSGMDNSSVARNVQSIKKSVNELKYK